MGHASAAAVAVEGGAAACPEGIGRSYQPYHFGTASPPIRSNDTAVVDLKLNSRNIIAESGGNHKKRYQAQPPFGLCVLNCCFQYSAVCRCFQWGEKKIGMTHGREARQKSRLEGARFEMLGYLWYVGEGEMTGWTTKDKRCSLGSILQMPSHKSQSTLSSKYYTYHELRVRGLKFLVKIVYRLIF